MRQGYRTSAAAAQARHLTMVPVAVQVAERVQQLLSGGLRDCEIYALVKAIAEEQPEVPPAVQPEVQPEVQLGVTPEAPPAVQLEGLSNLTRTLSCRLGLPFAVRLHPSESPVTVSCCDRHLRHLDQDHADTRSVPCCLHMHLFAWWAWWAHLGKEPS
jgi:hypothetical protein